MRRLAAALILLLSVTTAASAQQMSEADGESVVLNNDVSKARTEAILRAKWTAAENVLGVKVKAQSVVSNFALVDESIQKSVSGYVSTYKVMNEGRDGDLYKVRISAQVVQEKAAEAFSSLARITSAAVLMPAKGLDGEYEESNILSEGVIGRLAEQGFTMVDMASLNPGMAGGVEQAIKSNNTMFARSLMLSTLSNIVIIGKVDFTASSKKGEDAGYGLKMPFNIVTARLTYRIISAQDKKILDSGSFDAKGKAFSEKDAAAAGMKELVDKVSARFIDVLGKYMAGHNKKVKVVFENAGSVGETFGTKELLQNLAWVKSVEETRMNEFTVEYPENTLYLANSIMQSPGYRVRNFSQYNVTVTIEK